MSVVLKKHLAMYTWVVTNLVAVFSCVTWRRPGEEPVKRLMTSESTLGSCFLQVTLPCRVGTRVDEGVKTLADVDLTVDIGRDKPFRVHKVDCASKFWRFVVGHAG